MKELLERVFTQLDKEIKKENLERMDSGGLTISKGEICILGHFSLLLSNEISAKFNLRATADLDAKIVADIFIKSSLKRLLEEEGLEYDEDSTLIWLPPGHKFLEFKNFSNFSVKVLDPESALISKAVKAPEKNKVILKQVIEANLYPGLSEKIKKYGGKI